MLMVRYRILCVKPAIPFTELTIFWCSFLCFSSTLLSVVTSLVFYYLTFSPNFVTHYTFHVLLILGPAVAQWLRRCATNRKVAGSIPDGFIGVFH